MIRFGVLSSLLIILVIFSLDAAASSSPSRIKVVSTRPVGDRLNTEIQAGQGTATETIEQRDAHRSDKGRQIVRKRRRKRSLRSNAWERRDEGAEEGDEGRRRKLQDYEGKVHDFEDVISSLADTTPMEWTGMQWFCLIILLSALSTIFSCICGACCGCCRPRYGYGYGYGYGRRESGGGGCCSDIFWCLCCFEWCCRDCQDVDACCDVAYRGM